MARVLHDGRNRESGTLVSCADNRDGKLKYMPPHNKRKWPKGWITVCLTHGKYSLWDSRRVAAERMAHPTDWCSQCKDIGMAKRRGGGTPVRDQEESAGDDRLAVYRTVFNEWAPTAQEVAELLGMDKRTVIKHLRTLRSRNLVEDHVVNGEPPVVWQTYYDVENGGQWEEALADYREAWPA